MNVKLAVLAAAVVAGGAITAVVLARRQGEYRHERHAPAHEAPATALDAVMTAPAGATPCETAYNAIRAEREQAQEAGRSPFFTWLAERDTFMARCNQLPKDSQPCLDPRYATANQAACQRARPPRGALGGMFRMKDPPPEQAEDVENVRALFGSKDAGTP